MEVFAFTRKSWSSFLLFYICVYLLLILFLPKRGLDGDYYFWFNWASTIKTEGLGYIYYSDANYNPFTFYLLYLLQLVHPTLEGLKNHIYQIKAISLAFDFLGAFLAVKLVPAEWPKRLLNPGYLCNSFLWGQVDGVLAAFIFLAIILAIKNHPVASLAAYALALTTKLQAIIFLPAIGLLLLPYWRISPKCFFKGVLAFGGIWVLVLLPHLVSMKEFALKRLAIINFTAIDYYPVISANAFNIWYFFEPSINVNGSDTLVVAGFTLKQWGLLLFMAFSALILFPLAIRTLALLFKSKTIVENDWNMVLLSAGLIPIAFCFFNTQMHERYWHPAMILLAAYSFRSGNYSSFVFCCIAYFHNLYALLRYQDGDITIWYPMVTASLFGLSLLTGIIKLYQPGVWQQSIAELKSGNTGISS
jgi:Gpi18-like mannosyltransferase